MKRARKEKITPGDGDPRHGNNGYSNYNCRCGICTKAATESHYTYMYENPDQQEKNRDRSRKARGLSDDELEKLEVEYQQGKNRGGPRKHVDEKQS